MGIGAADGIDSRVAYGEVPHLGEPVRDKGFPEMSEIQVDIMPFQATPLLYLLENGPGHHIAGSKLHFRGRIAGHESFALGVSQIAPLAARRLRYENVGPV